MPSPIALAGATGNLGHRIARALRRRGVTVRALVRRSADPERVAALRAEGVEIVTVEFARREELAAALAAATCVVSALSGLREVIVDAQGALLDAAVAARVPRFIPSDFAIDFTKLPPGGNRNLDLRREFRARLDRAPIAATSIFNGMFAELLVGAAPIVLFRFHRVLYWERADQPMDFTTMDDVAAFTAAAALDPGTPRDLRVAGDTLDARGLARAAAEATGERFRLLRGGSLRRLERLTRVMRVLAPGKRDVYPPWQGMQYLRDMFDGRGALAPLDNARYPELRWTPVREVLARRGDEGA